MEDRRGPADDGGIVGGAARAGAMALGLAAVSCPIVFLALGLAQSNSSLFDVALWTIIGMVGAAVLFLGLLFIVYDRLCRMRQDRDYWVYLCNEFRQGRGRRIEELRHLCHYDTDLGIMDGVEEAILDGRKRLSRRG